MERATIFLNVDKKITPSWAFPLSPFVYCCQTPGTLCLEAGTLLDIFTPMREDFV